MGMAEIPLIPKDQCTCGRIKVYEPDDFDDLIINDTIHTKEGCGPWVRFELNKALNELTAKDKRIAELETMVAERDLKIKHLYSSIHTYTRANALRQSEELNHCHSEHCTVECLCRASVCHCLCGECIDQKTKQRKEKC